jgi:hypothetical protein
VVGPKTGTTDLRFMQGRIEIARVALPSDQVAELIGRQNSEAIARHVASDADKYLPIVRGELRGQRLQFAEVSLPGQEPKAEENSIGVTRIRRKPSAAPDKSPSGPKLREAVTDSSERTPVGPESPAKEAVLSHIAAKYLVKEDRYYFDDRTVAFIDQGSRLTVKTQNAAVLKDLVEIAKARDWQDVTVAGSRAFRREAWRVATAAGLQVTGYKPSGLERVASDRERERGAGETSPASRAAPRLSESRDPSEVPERSAARHDGPAKNVVYGKLIDHGVAPYQGHPAKPVSYFVTLKEDSGREHTHWGVGLGTALRQAQSGPQIGDRVGLERVGSTPVTVVQRATDAEGQAIREEITAKRYQWRIEREDYLRDAAPANPSAIGISSPADSRDGERGRSESGKTSTESKVPTRAQEAAAAIRSAETTREELQLKYPELNRAVFQHLASHEQFAAAYVRAGLIRESDRGQVIAQMRDRLAGQVERGRPVREPDGKQVSLLIRRSVDRVAADLGRTSPEVRSSNLEPLTTSRPLVREDVQVRA